MKAKIIYIYCIIVFVVNCKAQTTYSLLDDGIGLSSNAYYKDTDDELNKFTVTWKYQSGNIIFEITLEKKVMLYNPDFNNYCDILIGEYKYVENNTIIVNTLDNLQQNFDPYQNNISGAYIVDVNQPASQRRVLLYFSDPDRDYLNRSIILKYLPGQGGNPEKIQIEFRGETSVAPDENSPTTLRVPEQDYTLTKVP